MVFPEEAWFRQTPTLPATWAQRGSQPPIPPPGERPTPKMFGAVGLDHAGFIYLHQQSYFPWETDLAFRQQGGGPAFDRRRHRLYRMQDNASYHQKQEPADWFPANRRSREAFPRPPYWPERKATERIWQVTRPQVTHHRFLERPQDLCDALFRRFADGRHHPQEIAELLPSFS
jgi:hypothetical protein